MFEEKIDRASLSSYLSSRSLFSTAGQTEVDLQFDLLSSHSGPDIIGFLFVLSPLAHSLSFCTSQALRISVRISIAMSKDEVELNVGNLLRDESSSNYRRRHNYDDDAVLRRLGKRPVLTRSFGFMSILGFSCSALCSWESILLTSVPGLIIG